MLLIHNLFDGFIMELSNLVVIFHYLLIHLVQFLKLCIIVSLHVVHHLLERCLKVTNSLIVVTLELCVKFPASLHINLFNFKVVDVTHTISFVNSIILIIS